jgi:hypothetical protein
MTQRCLTTHNTHKGQISMFPAGFKTPIPARERPQTDTLDVRQMGSAHIIGVRNNFTAFNIHF